MPSEFHISVETQLTTLSAIYQAVTRAQVMVIIVSDPESLDRLRLLMNNFDDFITHMENLDASIVCLFYFV